MSPALVVSESPTLVVVSAGDHVETVARIAADALLIPLAQKGAANGVATLDSGSKIPPAQLPALAINEIHTVASQAAMLALAANPGDIAIRSDVGSDFQLAAAPASVLSNWVELAFKVTSVFGRTGAVTLAKSDVTGTGLAAGDVGADVAGAAAAEASARATAVSAETARAEAAEALAELSAHKDQASGYAGLDAGGLLKLAEMPSAVVQAAAPTSLPLRAESLAPLFPRMMATLLLGQKSQTWLTLTDSTGRDDTATGSPTTGWVRRTAVYLGALFPAYTVNYYTVADDAAFGVTISSATVLQTGNGTGNGGGPFVLNVYNAAIGGKNATFFINANRQGALVKNLLPDAVTISFGHNSTTETVQWWWPLLGLGTMVLANSAGCELALVAQNPEIAPSANLTQQQTRVSDVARVAEILGCPMVNVCQAFIDTGNVAAYTNAADGIHPNGGNGGGQALWASVIALSLLRGLYTHRPPSAGISGLHKAAANLVTNGAMAVTGGTLTSWLTATGVAVTASSANVTVAQDSTNFERTAQGYAAQLTANGNSGSGNYIKQTLDIAQCKGRWVTAIMRYYAASGQTDDVHIGRIGLSDGVKDAAHSVSVVNQNDRNSFSLAVCSLQVDPAATSLDLDLYVSSGATGGGSVITVQDVVVVLGPEPRGLPLQSGPTGATGTTGTTGATGPAGPQTDLLVSPAMAVAPAILLPLASDANDATNANNGTLVGSPSFGAGRYGIVKALALDGSTQWVTTTYNPFVLGGVQRTFFGWAKRTDTLAAHTLIGGSVAAGSHHPMLRIESGNENVKWWTDVTNDAVITWTAAWPGTGVWVHWALVTDTTAHTAALYINGALISSQSDTTDYTTGNVLQIGARAGVNPFHGSMALVGVYEGALSATQIATLAGDVTGDCAGNAGLKNALTMLALIGAVVDKTTLGSAPTQAVARIDLANSARNVLAETIPITAVGEGASTNSTIPSGELTGGIVGLVAGDVVKGVAFAMASGSPVFTLAKVVLTDTAGNIVASSADASGIIGSAAGLKSVAFSGAFTVVATGAYYIGFLGVTSGGTINVDRGRASSTLASAVDSGKTPIVKQTGLSDLPVSPVTWAAGNNAQAAYHLMAYS